MGRAAGSGSDYSFVLLNRSTGKYDEASTIDLPSVTTILKVLNKPALPSWFYRMTRDVQVGLVEMFKDKTEDLIDTMSDPEMYEEYLKENRLRPSDIANEASDRGQTEHRVLERLASGLRPRRPYSGWSEGILSWWDDRMPQVIESECLVWSLEHQFAGTVDLVWETSGEVIITDLKTRLSSEQVYPTDFLQVIGYNLAWCEMGGTVPTRTTVLVVGEAGDWLEYEVPAALDDYDAFLEVKATYDRLQAIE